MLTDHWMLNLHLNATGALWANDSLNFLLTSFTETYSKIWWLRKRLGTGKGRHRERVFHKKGGHQGQYVQYSIRSFRQKQALLKCMCPGCMLLFESLWVGVRLWIIDWSWHTPMDDWLKLACTDVSVAELWICWGYFVQEWCGGVNCWLQTEDQSLQESLL